MFSFSAIFFFLSFRIYTEIPALFLVLLGVYFFVENKHYFSGLSLGFAFLAKFPAPLFLVAALAVLLYKNEIKKSFYLCLGFATPVLPFLALNQIFYGNFLLPLIDARHSILNVLGCNVLWHKPFYYYFYIALLDNPLNIFVLPGIFYLFKSRDDKKILALLCLLLPLAYFTQLHCRDYRYMALFIPFLVMFSANGIAGLIRKKKYFKPVVFGVFVISLIISLNYYLLIFKHCFRYIFNIWILMAGWLKNRIKILY